MGSTANSVRSSLEVFILLWHKLSVKRKVQTIIQVVLGLLGAVAEILSLGSIIPFVAILQDPQRAWDIDLFRRMAIKLNLTSDGSVVLFIAIIFVAVTVLSTAVRVSNTYLGLRLSACIGSDLATEAYRRTLGQSLNVHYHTKSSSIINFATQQVTRSVEAIFSLFQLLVSAFTSFSIFLGLIVVGLTSTIYGSFVIIAIYALLAFSLRKRIWLNSGRTNSFSEKQIALIRDNLAGIRDIILYRMQGIHASSFNRYDAEVRMARANNSFYRLFPRFFLESLAIVFIALVASYLFATEADTEYVLPLIAALVFGAQKLLPALQQIYSSWASINGFNSDLNGLSNLLVQPIAVHSSVGPLVLNNCIDLDRISFRYPGSSSSILDNLSLTIKKGERIGIVGKSGAGKSTLADILLGLVHPQEGSLSIDGLVVNDSSMDTYNNACWRATLAHLPQSVQLFNGSILQNITLDLNPLSTDDIIDSAIKCSKIAQAHSFICSLPNGYHQLVGEGGTNLSGGQKQRIGIARALYRSSSFLVLDEPTNGLDPLTEDQFLKDLETIHDDITIVMITHKEETLRICTSVYELAHGQLVRVDNKHAV